MPAPAAAADPEPEQLLLESPLMGMAPEARVEPEIRVEEVARRADVSVDTIRFYQKRQLLPAPRRVGRIAWYGPDHLDRLARIKELQREGFRSP